MAHLLPVVITALSVAFARAMHYDETVYADDQEFRPERFLAEDGVTPVSYPDTKDSGHHGFGFGRR